MVFLLIQSRSVVNRWIRDAFRRSTVVEKNIGMLWWMSSCNLWFCLASTRKSQITTKDKVGNAIRTRIGKVVGIPG